MRRKNQENEAVWNRSKQKATPALLSGKPQTLQDTAKLCREWALKNHKDGVFNLGGKQVEWVVPGVNSQVGGFRYLNLLVNLKVIKLTEKKVRLTCERINGGIYSMTKQKPMTISRNMRLPFSELRRLSNTLAFRGGECKQPDKQASLERGLL